MPNHDSKKAEKPRKQPAKRKKGKTAALPDDELKDVSGGIRSSGGVGSADTCLTSFS
jgi:hypothetical protein